MQHMNAFSELPDDVKPDQDFREVRILDRGAKRSIVNLLPPALAAKVEDAVAKRPDLFNIDEPTLFKLLKQECATPCVVDNRLKLNFWFEYGRVQVDKERHMNTGYISGTICDVDYFAENYMRAPQKVAWLLCPPTGYNNRVREALTFTIMQLRDIVAEEHKSEEGELDIGLIREKRLLAQMFHEWDLEAQGKKPGTRAEASKEEVEEVITKATGRSTEQMREKLARLDALNKKVKHTPGAT